MLQAMNEDVPTIRSAVIRLVQALNAIYEENSIVVHRKQPNPVKFSLEDLVIADFTTCLRKSSNIMCSRCQFHQLFGTKVFQAAFLYTLKV